MFYIGSVKKAKSIYEQAITYYNDSLGELTQACEDLYEIREKSNQVISNVEELINSIANSPKEMREELEEVKKSKEGYQENLKFAKEQAAAMAEAGIGVAAGAALGGAFAAGVPKAALSIASAFGKATTGKAISHLSGYAAYKASAGWIARSTIGKVAPGLIVGSGFAQGEALLALAGPIGIAIGTASTAASLAKMSVKNKKIVHDSVNEIQDIMQKRNRLRLRTAEITNLKDETSRLLNSVKVQLENLSDCKDKDYAELSLSEQYRLGTLVNTTLSLAKKMTVTIEEDEEDGDE